ncbi:NADPH-dependent FMN reductase [Dickeya dadantii]|uniref:NADPH-dependent FMN reductase n=1 Tax=Dickeya dadantii TaxID=204038 RepID=UPI001C0CA52E|nr:NAD(P)H-dependent oxidoreductase [Dickeya dadantii]QWT40858.1 NAD(P)H-dependent oxidoreductase [Dickeya dadantii]
MFIPKILVISGSVRPGSYNTQLAAVATREIEAQGGSATQVNLADYPVSLITQEFSDAEIPTPVMDLHKVFSEHDGIFLTTPEYNAFPSPLLLNTLDWLSRVRHYDGGMDEVFYRPLYAISAASPSPFGGYRALMILRQKLEVGLRATVVPEMTWISSAYQAFGSDGDLAVEFEKTQLVKTVGQLINRLKR